MFGLWNSIRSAASRTMARKQYISPASKIRLVSSNAEPRLVGTPWNLRLALGLLVCQSIWIYYEWPRNVEATVDGVRSVED